MKDGNQAVLRFVLVLALTLPASSALEAGGIERISIRQLTGRASPGTWRHGGQARVVDLMASQIERFLMAPDPAEGLRRLTDLASPELPGGSQAHGPFQADPLLRAQSKVAANLLGFLVNRGKLGSRAQRLAAVAGEENLSLLRSASRILGGSKDPSVRESLARLRERLDAPGGLPDLSGIEAELKAFYEGAKRAASPEPVGRRRESPLKPQPAAGMEVRRFEGHEHNVMFVLESLDGRHLFTAGADGTARMWDKETGRELKRFLGHQAGVWALALSPDGRLLHASGDDGTIRTWDAETAVELRQIQAHPRGRYGGSLGLAASPDGRYLYSSGVDSTIRKWDARSGEEVLRFEGGEGYPTYGVVALRLSPDGRHLFSGGWDEMAHMWDVETGREARRFVGHEAPVIGIALSPDGRYLATGAGADNREDDTARVWEVETGREVMRFLGHRRAVWAVAFSPEGERLVTASIDGTARVWDLRTGRELERYQGHEGILLSVAPSSDGRHFYTGSSDRSARMWRLPGAPPKQAVGAADQVERGREIRVFPGHQDAVWSVAASPDGRYLLTAGELEPDGIGARLWDMRTGQELRGFSETALSNAIFSPDGRYLFMAYRDSVIRMLELETGKPVRSFEGHEGQIKQLALSPDGKRLMSLARDQTLRVWDVETGKETGKLEGKEPHSLETFALSSDGRTIVVRRFAKDFLVWDLEAWRALRSFGDQRSGAWRMLLSHDDRRLFTTQTGTGVHILDMESGQETLIVEHPGRVFALALSPDASRLFTGAEDGMARMWDARTGELLAVFEGHEGRIYALV